MSFAIIFVVSFMVYYKRSNTTEELQQILELQRRNLPHSLTSEEKLLDGFVTVEHDLEILSRMNNSCAHVIAKDGTMVIAYALCMHPKFGHEIEVLRPMFAEISNLEVIENFIVMGQVCIDKHYRKQGVFRTLYEEMLSGIKPEFQMIITEVDIKNSRSLNAHLGIGFEEMSRYHAGGQDWALICLKKMN